jgi:lysophospholipase-2
MLGLRQWWRKGRKALLEVSTSLSEGPPSIDHRNPLGLELIRTLFEDTMTSIAPVVVNAKDKHTGTIIFLHGLGDTGHGWASTIANIKPAHVKCICPTAPAQPVTLNGGFVMPSWFDLLTLEATGPEDAEGIKKAGEIIHKMIDEEVEKSGVPSERVILGGFSQGGGLAFHSALRYPHKLGGVLALSCWLPLHKEYPDAAQPNNRGIPVLQCHGDIDPIVPYRWGQMSSQIIKTFLSKYDFKMYNGLMHSSCEPELRDAKDFIAKALPPV